MGHTQTKLCISSESPKIIKCADFMGETSVIFGSASGYNGSGFFPTDDEAPHNARRLVACWNACDGVPTDALEQIEGFGKAALPYHQLKAQHAELLRALEALKDRCQDAKKALDAEIEDGGPVHPVSALLTWPTSVAITAIANAEKGGT